LGADSGVVVEAGCGIREAALQPQVSFIQKYNFQLFKILIVQFVLLALMYVTHYQPNGVGNRIGQASNPLLQALPIISVR
jgi:hypothetical protein